MNDYLIRNVRVMDPETNRDEICDAAIQNGRIAVLGKELSAEAACVIDGTGLILAPGFIDIHAHEDVISEEGLYDCLPTQTAEAAMKEGVTTLVTGNCGSSPWPMNTYLERVKNSGIPIHTPCLVGNITLRIAAGLTDRYQAASREQIETMVNLAEQAFQAGAAGISFGIQYASGTSMEEELALAAVAARYGKIMAVHMRYDFPEKALEGLQEVLSVAEQTGVSLQISHFAANIYGAELIDRAAEMIAASKAEVSADMYSYDAWATSLKSSVFDDGFVNFNFGVTDLELLTGPLAGQYCTQEIFDRIRGSNEPDVMVACHNAIPAGALEAAYRLPYMMMGSDSELIRTPEGYYLGHPRSASAVIRFLTEFAGEGKTLTLMDALSRMTILPAKKLGFSRKGRLQEGMDADLVLFALEELKVNATFGVNVCALPPDGIKAVFVGGKRVF